MNVFKKFPKPCKPPMIMQMESTECGAASLAMVLAYYGKWLPLERVREDCAVGRDGSSAGNILKAARSYGLTAKGYRSNLVGLKKMKFPAIIHWNFQHFVVLCGFKKNCAVINDPGAGRIEVSLEEFDRSFTGVVLTFDKGPDFQPGGSRASILEFVRKRLKNTASAMAFVIATSILAAAAGIVSPFLAQIFLDHILTGRHPDWLPSLLAALFCLMLFQFCAALVQNIYLMKLKGRLAISANAQLMWHILRLPVAFFSQRYAGEIARRQESNEEIAEILISRLAPVALNVGMMIFYFSVMIGTSPILTLVGLGAIGLNLFVTQVSANKQIAASQTQIQRDAKLSSCTLSGIEMIETIKAAGAEDGYFERWSGYNAASQAWTSETAGKLMALSSLPDFIARLADFLVLLLGAWLIIQGQFTPGVLMAFQGFLTSIMTPVGDMMALGEDFQEMRGSMEKVEDIMKYPVDVEDVQEEEEELENVSKLSGRITMEHITFGYSRVSPPLIRDFSMTLEPGQSVAFVGASGCGKSTLAKLISGLYKPWSGEIRYDGKLKNEIPRHVFTGSLSVVDQDIVLFEDSISENIKMWDKSIEDFEVIMAARDAQIHEDIAAREGGYQMKVHENGSNLSGGQSQRIEIARVLAQDPTLIVMDEATSALDARTEADVIRAIRDRGITCVIIAHRLSTVRDCDEIIVLEEGQVAERGTHRELYEKDGAYRRLISME